MCVPGATTSGFIRPSCVGPRPEKLMMSPALSAPAFVTPQPSVPEPRTLMVQPFDKTAIGAIEKAILTSDLGVTPSNDGNVIRLSFPPLTEERRRDLVKQVHSRAEDGRVAVRNVRRHHKDEVEKLEKQHEISEDDLKRAEKELQKLTDQFVAEIDEIQRHKEQELMEV